MLIEHGDIYWLMTVDFEVFVILYYTRYKD